MGEHQSEQARFRQKQYDDQNQQRIEEEKRQIDYVNRSIEKMEGLRTKPAWKSFLFLRNELKKLMRTWRTQIDHPDTPENKRLYFLGCVYGAKVIFQISQNFIQMKKEIESGNPSNVLKFFQRGGK